MSSHRNWWHSDALRLFSQQILPGKFFLSSPGESEVLHIPCIFFRFHATEFSWREFGHFAVLPVCLVDRCGFPLAR